MAILASSLSALAQHLDDHPLPTLPFPLAVEHLLSRTEIELAGGDGTIASWPTVRLLRWAAASWVLKPGQVAYHAALARSFFSLLRALGS
jgi:hypothetical protein